MGPHKWNIEADKNNNANVSVRFFPDGAVRTPVEGRQVAHVRDLGKGV